MGRTGVKENDKVGGMKRMRRRRRMKMEEE